MAAGGVLLWLTRRPCRKSSPNHAKRATAISRAVSTSSRFRGLKMKLSLRRFCRRRLSITVNAAPLINDVERQTRSTLVGESCCYKRYTGKKKHLYCELNRGPKTFEKRHELRWMRADSRHDRVSSRGWYLSHPHLHEPSRVHHGIMMVRSKLYTF